MATILAHITVIAGCEERFEAIAEDLFVPVMPMSRDFSAMNTGAVLIRRLITHCCLLPISRPLSPTKRASIMRLPRL